jgi:hypothetical protein
MTTPPKNQKSTLSRWDMSRWTVGKTSFFNALGVPWNIHFPSIKAGLASQAANATSSDTANKGTSNPNQSLNNTAGNVNTPSSQSETDWWKAVLMALGAPTTTANINSLSAWRKHESPWNASPPDGALYTNNPLNTTLSGHNTVGNVNSVGVKRYATPRDGVAATVATMLGGYPAIVSRLRSGQGLCGFSSAEFSKWSGGGYSSVC